MTEVSRTVNRKAVLLGNEAIARGIVEAGCLVASGYPGTPSSEILTAVARFADQEGVPMAVEWSVNEKVGVEVALAASFTGARACAVMKEAGLNVAADPFLTASLYDMKGGMVIVSADDPGPHSSQTEQDSRNFAMIAKIPCLDPSSAAEAKDMAREAFHISEKFHVITMLRPAVRVDHCRQDVELGEVLKPQVVKFEKDPERWVCLPAGVRINHPRQNRKLEEIRSSFEKDFQKYNFEVPSRKKAVLGVVASGVSYSVVMDILAKWGREDVSVLKIGTPHPLPVKMVTAFMSRHEKVLFLEEPGPVMEMQVPDRTRILGRWNGVVPGAGELLPEVIAGILGKILQIPEETAAAGEAFLKDALRELGITPRKPTLCAGCPHRASNFSIRQAIPNAINPSDIGCYSLSVNQKAVDAVVDMGGSVSMSSGFFLAHMASGQDRPIVSTIGDSTFFHMGIPGLVNAVYNRHAFVLAILDNSITAMTGGQANPGVGSKLRKGDEGKKVDLEGVCRGCGLSFVKTVEAYDVALGKAVIREAWEHARSHREPAVVIFRHPCMLLRPEQPAIPVKVDQDTCIGCKFCINFFNCPGLVFDGDAGKAVIDERFCVSCGVCTSVCPHGAIVARGEGK